MEKKTNQREVTQKMRKKWQSFLHCLDLIHIAIKFYQDMWLLSYDTHKDSVKSNKREVTRKLRKTVQSFLYMTHRTHCYKVSSRYSICLPAHATHKVSQKFNQREVSQKLRKGEYSFLYATHCLNSIHIAIKFRQDIP